MAMLTPMTGQWKDFLRNHARPGIPVSRFYKLDSLLSCIEPEFFNCLNNSFKEYIQLPGMTTLDETMWEWSSDHPAVVSIPRKPNSKGVKVFTYCFKFTHSDLPYCFHFIPDITRPGFSAAAMLDIADIVYHDYPNTSVTTDSWFSRLPRMRGGAHVLSTTSLGTDEEAALTRVVRANLTYHQYRTFRSGDICLTFFLDNDLMRTASNCFEVRASSSAFTTTRWSTGRGAEALPPRLSLGAIGPLLQLSSADLEVLASAFGEARGLTHTIKF